MLKTHFTNPHAVKATGTPARRLAWLLALALLLAACGGLTEEPEEGGDCLPADLVAPTHTTPATDYEIILDLDHIFVWSYSSCEPEGWRVELATHDPSTYTLYPDDITESALPLPAQTSWVFDDVLQPATAYEWHVAAYDSGVLGPYSATTIFWTGPICESDELDAPIQISPEDESVIDTPEGPFFWDYSGGCVPESAFFELGTTPGFPGDNLGTGLGPPRKISYPQEPLEDCTEYFWRVRSESEDGEGPWSPVWSFSTDFEGECEQQGGGNEGGGPPEPAGPPMGLATRDLNCREGDNTVFNESGFFEEGAIAEILGKNAEETWLVVPLRLGGGNCWVSGQFVDLLDGATLDDVPVFPSPPLPATPTSPPDDAPPAAPQNPSTSRDCTSTQVTVLLAWTDVADNEDGYRIYSNGALIATLPANASEYTDNSSDYGQKSYTIEAFNDDGVASIQVQVSAC